MIRQMTGHRLVFLFVLSFLFLTPFTTGFQKTIVEALPGDNDAEGWKKTRAMQHYAGEDLYEYINGGAEIYHEYGFVRVVVQDYVNDEGKSVSVEIFEMTSPASAYGMYTFKTDAKGKKITIGSDAQLADYYMNFWKGPFLVTLTGFDETEITRAGLLDIARNVGSKISAEGDKPRIVSLLPEEDLLDQSLKYFTGFLGLRNSHPFFQWNIPGFEQGIKGDYSGGFSFFLFRFEGIEKARGGFQSMEGQKDRRGRNLFVAVHGEYLMLVLGEADQNRANRIFGRARRKIDG